MNKKITLILTLVSLIFISCSGENFSEDLQNFNTCSEHVLPIGDCIEDKYGYEFDTDTDTCNEIIVKGCAIQTPFESMVECQSACYTSEKHKKKKIIPKLE